jgi:DNA-binding PadR family transcriptional regulator
MKSTHKFCYSGKKHEFDGGHGMHGGRSGGAGGHESRRPRVFNAGELSLVLLHLMEGRSRHGYDLIRELASLTGGAYSPSAGIVYPTLSALEDAGEIEAVASEGAKRLFAITPAGRARLEQQTERIAAAMARLDALGAAGDQIDAGPVARAMQNLAVVLEQSLTGKKEKQALFDIADLIDEAARKIERLP